MPDTLLLLRDEVEHVLTIEKGGETHCYLNSLKAKESVRFRKLEIWKDLQRHCLKSPAIVPVSVVAGTRWRTIVHS